MKKKLLLAFAMVLLCCFTFGMTVCAEDDKLTSEEMQSAVVPTFGQEYKITWESSNYILEKVTLPDRGVITMTSEKVDSAVGILNYRSYVYDAEGNLFWYNISAGKDTKDVCYIALDKGTYYVKRQRRYPYGEGKTATYKIEFTAKNDYELEVAPTGDLKKTATAIEPDKFINGFMGSGFEAYDTYADEVDTFKVKLTKGKGYKINAKGLKGTSLICIAMKNEDVTSVSNKYHSDFAFVAPYTGYYYVSVWNYTNTRYSYSLKVETIKVPNTKITSLKKETKGFTVKYKKVSCDGYEIQYSTSKKMLKAKTVSVNKAKTVKKTVKKLSPKKKYYVRVRSFKKIGNKKVYSQWSNAKSVTTK